MYPFHWLDADTVTCAVSTVSGDFPLLKIPTGKFQLRVYNAGLVPVFIRKGSGGVAATAVITDLPISPGAVEVFTVNNTGKAPITSIGAITGSSTATFYFTVGEGL